MLFLLSDPERPVLLAYESNGEALTQAHGAPLRLVVPGIIGARSVKWIEKIVLRDYEVRLDFLPSFCSTSRTFRRVLTAGSSSQSEGFYQQRDCTSLPPLAHRGKAN